MERKTSAKLWKIPLATVIPIRVTERAQALASDVLNLGDIAIDATAGKGRDTAFLAQTVGPTGWVHSFDIQAEAIASTEKILVASGLINRVTLHHLSHAEISTALPESHRGKISVALFNLGYLPGSDQKIITHPESTSTALQSAFNELKTGGRLICVAYTGHPGGKEESQVVEKFAEMCEKSGNSVEKFGYTAHQPKPWILMVTRD
ncbi:MAG: methyltransferase domain-containing protein [Opitutales bacterium]|nr:methyltransferase domain-containing protein [Opitutales bacterium]